MNTNEPRLEPKPEVAAAPRPKGRRYTSLGLGVTVGLSVGAVALVVGLAALVVGLVVGVEKFVGSTTEPIGPLPPMVSADPQLELLSLVCAELDETGEYIVASGIVRNMTDKHIDRIHAVATWTSNDGRTINTDSMRIAADPLPAGGTSIFVVLSNNDPNTSKCNVSFELWDGDIIPTASNVNVNRNTDEVIR